LRTKRLTITLLIPVLITLGCDKSERQEGAPAATVETSAPRPSQAVERTAAIYAAVIRQLVTKDHTFGRADPGFKVVYVLDGAVDGADDPMKTTDEYLPDERFGDDLEARLKEKLADLPPIVFVKERGSVIEGNNGGSAPSHVIDDGVLLTLGPIVGDERRVEVGSNLWIDGLAGFWATYVVEHRGAEWKLTGTTGPVAIS
jgi:hypothetical protein